MKPRNVTLYAYLNINHPMVAWEVAIGRVRSSCDLDRKNENFAISLWQYNLFKKYSEQGLSQRLVNELKLERLRKHHYSGHVSRLKGMYFFETERDAHAAVERWGFPDRRQFISEVNFSANNITRADSEWITSYLATEETAWMNEYWSGRTLGYAPLTEVLASGIGQVCNKELRVSAYKKIMGLWPTSTPLLAIACCAYALGKMKDIALVVPGLTSEESKVRAAFYIDMGELDRRQNEIEPLLAECIRIGEMPPVIRPSNPEMFFSIPDLSSGSFEFGEESVRSLYSEVHDSVRA